VADFTSFVLEANTGSQGTPTWTSVLAAGREVRFSDVSTVSLTTPSASWPFVTRPASGTSGVDYAYAATADAVLLGVLGSAGAPTAFTNASYLQYRWNWDAVGTFASAPIFTAYPTTAHGAISRGDGTILGGHATDTGATARSYLKGNAFGRVTSAGAPAAAPANAPVVTDGATGSLAPTAGANWLTNYQGLQGDNDFITAPFTPAATAADQWNVMMRLFMGVSETPGTYTPQASLKYTWT
jgi:hypothetical protein